MGSTFWRPDTATAVARFTPGSSDVEEMLVKVRVTPNAREARVTKVDEANYEVKVDERATDGRANKRLLEILSKHFGVPKSRIVIVSGARSRDKVLAVS